MRKDSRVKVAVISFITAMLLLLFFPYFILNNIQLGQFKIVIPEYDRLGTFISGVTAPFLSLAAFVLLYLTYKSQKEELSDSKKILNEQSETQQTQRFETTFFNLLNLHHSIVNSIDLKISVKHTNEWKGEHWFENEEKKGRDCFREFYSAFTKAYNQQKRYSTKWDGTKHILESELVVVKESYNTFFAQHQHDLGHYFRNLYHLVKFIDNSEMKNKQMYVSLVRAQLSSHELLLIFYNCASDFGQKFTQFMPAYHFFKNMPTDLLLESSHKSFYPEKAYQ